MKSQARHLFRNLLRRRTADADLTAELASFLAERPHAARLEQLREEVRSARLGSGLEGWVRDLRLAARSLGHAPKFTIACVLTFALGIGANVAIFSMANALLFRPLPVAEPQQLQSVQVTSPQDATGALQLAPTGVRMLRRQGVSVFSSAAVVVPLAVGLSIGGQARTVQAMYATPDLFPLLGIHPTRGRFFTQRREQGIVLSYAYWQSRFGGRADVVGHAAVLQGIPVAILGVAPKGFHGIGAIVDTQVYVPFDLAGTLHDSTIVLVRLKPGVSASAGDAVLSGFAATLARRHPAQDKGLVLRLQSLQDGVLNPNGGDGPVIAVAALFLALSALVLLLAAANIMGLLLARASRRRREMAVRSALGASRTRLLRQVFLETALLALGGTIAGTALGAAAGQALSALRPAVGIPLRLNFSLDWRVLSYALGMAVLVALVAGIAPAWRAASADPNHALRAEGDGVTRRQRLRSTLVGVQVAAALVLLIVAGLFVRSLRRAEAATLGFVADGVWTYSFDVQGAGYASAAGAAFYRKLLPQTRLLPGVESAALAQVTPFGSNSLHDRVSAGKRRARACYSPTSGGYFTVLRVPLLRGRDFNSADRASVLRVAIVSRTLARELWPGADPIGQSLFRNDDSAHPLLVVGVAGDVEHSSSQPEAAFYYVPFAQAYQSHQTLLVRLRRGVSPAAIGAALGKVDSNVPMSMQSMHETIGGINGLYLFRLGAELAGWMGLFGLLLALVGVYGVVAYAAEQRRRELDIRVALGAGSGALLAAVARPAIAIIGSGIVIGLLLAAAVGKVAGALLQGVSGLDPVTFIAATVILAAVAAVAALVPAWRAARADPLAALRCE